MQLILLSFISRVNEPLKRSNLLHAISRNGDAVKIEGAENCSPDMFDRFRRKSASPSRPIRSFLSQSTCKENYHSYF